METLNLHEHTMLYASEGKSFFTKLMKRFTILCRLDFQCLVTPTNAQGTRLSLQDFPLEKFPVLAKTLSAVKIPTIVKSKSLS